MCFAFCLSKGYRKAILGLLRNVAFQDYVHDKLNSSVTSFSLLYCDKKIVMLFVNLNKNIYSILQQNTVTVIII